MGRTGTKNHGQEERPRRMRKTAVPKTKAPKAIVPIPQPKPVVAKKKYVETEEQSYVVYAESNAVKPINKDEVFENDWPMFVLNDAKAILPNSRAFPPAPIPDLAHFIAMVRDDEVEEVKQFAQPTAGLNPSRALTDKKIRIGTSKYRNAEKKWEEDWKLAKSKEVPVNLLQLGSPNFQVLVTGKLEVDDEYKNHLVKFMKDGRYVSHNGDNIVLGAVTRPSIGMDPTTLWVDGNGGWYEIRPAEDYREMYEKMADCIGILDSSYLYYEYDPSIIVAKSTSIGDDVNSILSRYIYQQQGHAKTLPELLAICKENAKFMVAEYRNKSATAANDGTSKKILWAKCHFYAWILSGCKEVPKPSMPFRQQLGLTKKKFDPVSVTPPRVDVKGKGREVSQHAQSTTPAPTLPARKPYTEQLAPTQQPTTQQEDPAEFKPGPIKAHHGSYYSPEFPQGIQPDFNNPQIIACVASHAIHSKRIATEINFAKLKQMMYTDFRVDPSISNASVVHYYSNAVRDVLVSRSSAKWSNSLLCKELKAAPPTFTSVTGDMTDKQRAKVALYTTGGAIMSHREQNKNLRAARGSLTTTATSRLRDPGSSPALQDVAYNSAEPPPKRRRVVADSAKPGGIVKLAPHEKHRDRALISTAETKDAAEEPVRGKFDSNDRPFPVRIKRSGY